MKEVTPIQTEADFCSFGIFLTPSEFKMEGKKIKFTSIR